VAMMPRTSAMRKRAPATAGLLVVVAFGMISPTQPSVGFVLANRSSAPRAPRVQIQASTQASGDAIDSKPFPDWFPFASMLNDWLKDMVDAASQPPRRSVTLSEYEAMNDEIADMRVRLQSARDRERRAEAAMEELEALMEKERQEIEEEIASLTRKTRGTTTT
ncbi:PAPL, partial [Symbiodinium pilosum]